VFLPPSPTLQVSGTRGGKFDKTLVQHDLQTTPPPWLRPGLVCRESGVTPRCVDRVGYGKPALGAREEDWRGSSLVLGDQGPNWMSVTIHWGHALQASTKTQTPCTIMPQNRWTRLRYPDWESEDVSNKRDMEPQPCAYHDVTSSSSACTALALGCLLV
jgi:hypothetical protein